MSFGNALRSQQVDPRLTPGYGISAPNLTGVNPFGGGGMSPMGGQVSVPQIGAGGGAGGWGGAMTRAQEGMTNFEKMYLISSGVAGVNDWWEKRKERQFRERVYEEGRADQKNHEATMGANLNAAWGG